VVGDRDQPVAPGARWARADPGFMTWLHRASMERRGRLRLARPHNAVDGRLGAIAARDLDPDVDPYGRRSPTGEADGRLLVGRDLPRLELAVAIEVEGAVDSLRPSRGGGV